MSKIIAKKRPPKGSDDAGQASVEYAIVLTGFLALIIALGAIHSFLEEGALVTHALQSSSHAVENICTGTTKDIMGV